MKSLRKKMIEKIGKEYGNNKSSMAKVLGISRVTLQKKIAGEAEKMKEL